LALPALGQNSRDKRWVLAVKGLFFEVYFILDKIIEIAHNLKVTRQVRATQLVAKHAKAINPKWLAL
jgi:hypothetical protein